MMPNLEKGRKKSSWLHSFWKSFIKRNNDRIILQMTILPVVPFIVILVQAILWPGMIYCNDNGCDHSLEPAIPDVITIPIGLIIYAVSVALSIMILSAPGSWMKRAWSYKVISMIVLLLIACSVVQIIAPAIYRGYAYPYYQVTPYNVTIERVSTSMAFLNVSQFWPADDGIISEDVFQLYKNGQRVMVIVSEATGQETNPNDLSPFAKQVFRDGSYSDTTSFSLGKSITRNVDNLESDQWYMWMVIPARKGINGEAYIGDYIVRPGEMRLYDGTVISSGDYIDLRGYRLCQWNANIGCKSGDAYGLYSVL